MKFTLVHSGASGCNLIPGLFIFEVASPEGEIAALRGADFIDCAAVIEENTMAVGEVIARCERIFAWPHHIGNYFFAGEIFCFFEEIDEAVEFCGREIYDAWFAATAGAALFAGESETIFPEVFHCKNLCKF